MATIGALTFIAGVLGLIKPSLLRLPNRKAAAAILVIGFIVTAAAGASGGEEQAPSNQPAQEAQAQEQPADAEGQQDNQQQPGEATQEPGGQEQQPKGIGVSRAEIQSVYESPELGFKFEKGEPVDGQPQVIGRSPNGLAYIQLIGPEDNITQASIMVGIPNDNPVAVVENGIYMLGLVKKAAPDWSEGPDWVTENLAKAVEKGEISTTHGDLRINLQASKELGMVVLTIASNE